MQTADCVIVGAGIAGVATAWHLVRRGLRRVVIVEQEPRPARHSSGRSAAMVRQVVSDEATGSLARAGRDWIAKLTCEWNRRELFAERGSLLLASRECGTALREDADRCRAAGRRVDVLSKEAALDRVPALARADFEIAVAAEGDGTLDAVAFIERLLEDVLAGGGALMPVAPFRALELDSAGRVAGVKAGNQAFSTRRVVNAAGPWAKRVAAHAGATPISLTPFRRHVFRSDAPAGFDPEWPFVWDVEVDCYFRPDRNGVLACACDHTAVEPSDVQPEPDLIPVLERKILRTFPALGPLEFHERWAGLRTFASDGAFVIGPDPRIDGFHWVAGLGGHGITVALAAGELAAAAILDPDVGARGPFDPRRFALGGAARERG